MYYLIDTHEALFKRGRDKKPRDERSDKGISRKKNNTARNVAIGAGASLATLGLAAGAYKLGGVNAAKKAVKTTGRYAVKRQSKVINGSIKDDVVGKLAKKGAIAFDKLGSNKLDPKAKEMFDLYKGDLQDIPDRVVGRIINKSVGVAVKNGKSTAKAATQTKKKPRLFDFENKSPIYRALVRRKNSENK